MSSERIQMSPEQAQRISNMLQSQGISQSEIDQIINGEYETYGTEYDIESSLGGLKKYGDVLEKLSDGYTMDELQTEGISTQKIQEFQDMLQERNLTVDGAKSIYQYSVSSNMILGVKRGVTKDTIKDQIIQDLESSLQTRGVPQTDIETMKQFIKNTDYQETLHSNYDRANEYMEQMGIQPKARVSVRNAMQSMDRCAHIDETISSLDEGLGRTNLPKSMKLYRAVKSGYLEKALPKGEDLSSLVGKTVSNNGQTSTSPLYDSSFAKYDDYDTVFEIYAPEGSRGSYITELSAYDNVEQEVLLNPNDLYITNVQKGVIDKNGKTKNVLQALALSKDRECYKEIEQLKGKNKEQSGIAEQNIQSESNTEFSSNLPTKQNRFSKFFSQVRARFARQKTQEHQEYSEQDNYSSQTKQGKGKVQEKKSWELEPEEKTRIQKETAKIAQKHREQQKQQKQVQNQELQQGQANKQGGEYQQENTEQLNQGQAQVPVQPQQPMMDMGGMEL